MSELKIGGLTGLTTIDFPGQLAAVIFCQGCPWRCPYCHNPHLLNSGGPEHLQWSQVSSFMEQRRGFLDGVVFSGGEPTTQRPLLQAVQEMKQMGFSVGLHTAGPYPDRLDSLLAHLDWIALDIKAPFDAYDKITGVSNSGKKAKQSALLVLQSGLPYEFRTTVYPDLIDDASLIEMAGNLHSMGVQNYALQNYRPPNHPPTAASVINPTTIDTVSSLFPSFEIR